jgi:hypothetical protein
MSAKKIIIAMSVIAVLVIAAMTNPDREMHKAAIRKKLMHATGLDEQLAARPDSTQDWSPLGATIGLSLGLSMADQVLEHVIEVDNYVLFSITKATYEGHEARIGLGLFGNVFLSSRLDELDLTKGLPELPV